MKKHTQESEKLIARPSIMAGAPPTAIVFETSPIVVIVKTGVVICRRRNASARIANTNVMVSQLISCKQTSQSHKHHQAVHASRIKCIKTNILIERHPATNFIPKETWNASCNAQKKKASFKNCIGVAIKIVQINAIFVLPKILRILKHRFFQVQHFEYDNIRQNRKEKRSIKEKNLINGQSQQCSTRKSCCPTYDPQDIKLLTTLKKTNESIPDASHKKPSLRSILSKLIIPGFPLFLKKKEGRYGSF